MPPWSAVEASVDVVCRLHQRINDVYDVSQIDVVVVGIFHQVSIPDCHNDDSRATFHFLANIRGRRLRSAIHACFSRAAQVPYWDSTAICVLYKTQG